MKRSIADSAWMPSAASQWISSEELEAAINLLPPPYAEVIRLHRQAVPPTEIARRIALPVGAVASRMVRAYRCLRQILHDGLPSDVRG